MIPKVDRVQSVEDNMDEEEQKNEVLYTTVIKPLAPTIVTGTSFATMRR